MSVRYSMVSYGLKMNKLIQSFLSRSPAGARQTAEREQTVIYYSLLSRTVCEISEFCLKASLSNVSTHHPPEGDSQPDPLYFVQKEFPIISIQIYYSSVRLLATRFCTLKKKFIPNFARIVLSIIHNKVILNTNCTLGC